MEDPREIRMRTAFLLLCRDDEIRSLVGTAWKCFTFGSYAELEEMLACLEPYERHFGDDLHERHLLLYQDRDTTDLWSDMWNCHPDGRGTVWMGYTFKNSVERDEMIADIDNPDSAWKRDAVPVRTSTLRMPKSSWKTKSGRAVIIRQIEMPVTDFN